MRLYGSLLAILLATLTCTADAHSGQPQNSRRHRQVEQKEIQWHTDFERAHRLSKRTGKPLFVLFTGSDWCTWCKKLEHEVFAKTEFAQLVGDRLVFVMADFPMRNTQPAHIQRQNDKLRQDFNVEGYPTVLCLDPDLNQIAVLGYRRGGAKRYGNYVLSLLAEYDELAWQMKSLNEGVFNAEQLKDMYQQARASQHDDYIAAILGAGLKLENNSFFLIEKYRELMESEQGTLTEAQELRKTLLEPSRGDHQESSYRVAVIDFQALSEKYRQDEDPSRVLAPLLGFIEEFSDTEDSNIWKVHMMVSQVFSSKEQWQAALHHAQESQKLAPEPLQGDVQEAIRAIQKHIKV